MKAKGVKTFVIDPFNRIEQGAEYGTKMEFIQKSLGKFIQFAKTTDSLVLLIAHPTKLKKEERSGKFPMATAYDISGSADFFNMPSYVISVRREQDDETLEFLSYGQIGISKAKHNETMGTTGMWKFRYNINNGRYSCDEQTEINFDNSNWITKQEYIEPRENIVPISPSEAFQTSIDDDFPF